MSARLRGLPLVCMVAGLLASLLPFSAAAQSGLPGATTPGAPHRAGLVVRFGDGRVRTACVAFAEPSIDGVQLLERSGLKPILNPSGALGGAVCAIEDQGCRYPTEDCFCRCTGSQCQYWAYYQWKNSGWQYSQVGGSAVRVVDGDLQGWSWGPGNFSSGTEPPKVAFADVCAAGATIPGGAGSVARAGPGTLLQYAAYGLIAAALLGAGVWVIWQRRTARRAGRHREARGLGHE